MSCDIWEWLTVSCSLRCMFSCVQFESSLRVFQTLLSEGMFDSDCGLSPGVLQHYRHLLTLSDLRTSGWIERCSTFSNRAKRKGAMDYSKVILECINASWTSSLVIYNSSWKGIGIRLPKTRSIWKKRWRVWRLWDWISYYQVILGKPNMCQLVIFASFQLVKSPCRAAIVRW